VLRLVLLRLALGAGILWAVSVVVFAATQALPGDAAQAILGRDATPERLAALREQLHLGGSAAGGYARWLGGVLRLDFGSSLATGTPVTTYLADRILNTVVLLVCVEAVAVPVAVLAGVWGARRRRGLADHAVSLVTLVLAALPEFVIGILLVITFSTGLLHILPPVYVADGDAPPWSHPAQLVLPTATLALTVGPYLLRHVRAAVVEVLDSPYVRFARLKGLPERRVLWRHVLPAAAGPVVQVLALSLGWLTGGTVVVEYLFRYPGVGFTMVDAVNNRDLPVIQALTLLVVGVYVVVNLLGDLAALVASPRLRTGAS
jgi:peptide/nickel transport system permease protein